MGSCSEEQDQFFDTCEDIASVSDCGSDGPENFDCNSKVSAAVTGSCGYEVWIKNPGSISERRNKFLKWMGLSSDQPVREDCELVSCYELDVETDRIMESSGTVLRTSGSDDGISSSQSSRSCWSSDGRELLESALEENLMCRIKNLDYGSEFIVDELGQDGPLQRLRKVGSNQLVTIEEFEKTFGLSPLVQRVMRKGLEDVRNFQERAKRVRKGWLKRLGSVACVVDRQGLGINDSCTVARARTQIVKVRSYRKQLKEFTALYMGQDILAHDGSILTMKFSPDGQHLASAGEDGIVRVWQVMESERSNEFDIPDTDTSYMCFAVNDISEIVPLNSNKEKKGRLKSLRKSSDAARVVFPQKVFQILEKPVHEFHGHEGEVLDLSWSKNKCLLSSSVDKTVRLWRVGCDQCLQVFSHNNYVTCVQFNPVDDNYFISGSIDGKVRVWVISGCQVVDWTDITEIVTAVCYRPDGKGGIVGSMNGNCRFYDASDNHLQLYAQICLQGKSKSPFKRITGFQFSPIDPSKLIVTSADAQVRILHGIDVICKFRGLRSAGSQIPASFTSDGFHIVSASEDSNVYVWNYISQEGPVSGQVRKNWSCEHFFSNNALIAIPWCGMTSGNSIFSSISGAYSSSSSVDSAENISCQEGESSCNPISVLPPDHFSRSHRFFSDSSSKGSATWPEEKLPTPTSLVVSSTFCKSKYKLLKKSCQSMFGSPHAWGLVIVTAGWDGRIRSFQNYGLPIYL
ncbi:uncharacterized protein LOC131166444 [Malania oleifera]|uniref:uncharacterized protein LOC131166444 n=1 Tax=Malania oleifera TaxID=397392 RepID=UPI0025ADEF3C|nr:uncharacterized protein LOC131166444 [Malania oleifera]XP_057981003.1 uncharacterized protein LOC131166444 [Malania oleifera]XP_057981004.1 uncharacterized protein LOC131166444 [Malania oleifera]